MDVRSYLQQLHEEGNYREIPTVMPLTLTDYSTNDYMGLAAQPELQAKFSLTPFPSRFRSLRRRQDSSRRVR